MASITVLQLLFSTQNKTKTFQLKKNSTHLKALTQIWKDKISTTPFVTEPKQTVISPTQNNIYKMLWEKGSFHCFHKMKTTLFISHSKTSPNSDPSSTGKHGFFAYIYFLVFPIKSCCFFYITIYTLSGYYYLCQ